MKLQTKILAGYLVLVAVICSMAAILVHERGRMHERYAYRLKLTAGGNTSRRRVLLKSLPLPQAGAYLDAAPGLLRQVYRL